MFIYVVIPESSKSSVKRQISFYIKRSKVDPVRHICTCKYERVISTIVRFDQVKANYLVLLDHWAI